MPYERVGSINLATGENDFGAMICAHCDEEFSGLEEIEDRTDRQWQCPCCGGWNDRKTQAA
jgi:hypothetical protein